MKLQKYEITNDGGGGGDDTYIILPYVLLSLSSCIMNYASTIMKFPWRWIFNS